MRRRIICGLGVFMFLGCLAGIAAEDIELGGRLPQGGNNVVVWWTLSSAAKVRPDTKPAEQETAAVQMRCARNEYESVQVVVRPEQALHHLTIQAGSFAGPGQQMISSNEVEILQATYLNVTTPTDGSTKAGLWPDPLVPMRDAVDLPAGTNQAFWVRVHVVAGIAPGIHKGTLRMRADGWEADVPLELTVYKFALPDQMTCQTAFGFSPGEVFRYQHLETEEAKRQVLEKYWANLAAHHISPYDPAPLDSFSVTWPKVQPPKSQWDQWSNLRLVQNECHSGKSALLVYDDKADKVVEVSYLPLIPIPAKGLHLRGWYRTAIPGHRFTVSLNHYDADKKWMSGHNRDIVMAGNGQWQSADFKLTEFPEGAKYVVLHLMGTVWTEEGENLGLVWFDDISIQNLETGEELIQGGDFEPKQRTELVAAAEQLHPTLDFGAWDKAMTRAFDQYHFNSFSVPMVGMGGGTFHELSQPNLLGFGEDAPEYPLLLSSYCREVQDHLRAKGWLDKAFIYWFDEPSEDQYPYLQNGFNKLKQYCPDITRMITKLVEPGLIGGPNLWCPISDQYNHKSAEERRKLGERFWWYVCTGPKAPYAGIFLDHPAPEMRIWLWQTFQRNINGILVWQCNYWNSDTAYPEAGKLQNPLVDPMSWMTGYGTPAGKKSPWGNGDGRFIYPPLAAASGNPASPVMDGPVDSIRWEQLRDGIEDYEYLTILRSKLNQRRATLSAEKVQEYEKLLEVPETITKSMTEFTPNGGPIEMRRDQIARAIETL
jgi:hypothetical protein